MRKLPSVTQLVDKKASAQTQLHLLVPTLLFNPINSVQWDLVLYLWGNWGPDQCLIFLLPSGAEAWSSFRV